MRVEWLEVAGERCWFASGTGDAKREAVPAIEHIVKNTLPLVSVMTVENAGNLSQLIGERYEKGIAAVILAP